MKLRKLFASALAVCLMASLGCAAAAAKTGDVIGSVYSTDIRAFINGVEVPSYNIGGRTAVVVEDVLPHSYNNEYRALIIGGFDPAYLRGGRNPSAGKVGRVTGRIYATDIKTYVYTARLPAYNIGGKTAVAIEDLGGDRVFNDLGGKYRWDAAGRTISLDFLYDRPVGLPPDTPFSLEIHARDGALTLSGDRMSRGAVGSFYEWSEGAVEGIVPLTLDGETVGWYVCKPCYFYCTDDGAHFSLEKGTDSFSYFDPDKMAAAIAALEVPRPTRDEVIQYYETRRLAETVERFDTDAYSFLYMTGSTPHGSTKYLLYVTADGSWHDFAADFERTDAWGTIGFASVEIDRENERVRLTYQGAEYVIDLKTGVMTAEVT